MAWYHSFLCGCPRRSRTKRERAVTAMLEKEQREWEREWEKGKTDPNNPNRTTDIPTRGPDQHPKLGVLIPFSEDTCGAAGGLDDDDGCETFEVDEKWRADP